ncbi:hypothetical protein CHISP_2070 [Chitinispirillum alkaliphilum]|nr:hypothetical protein CHISP_2070 [Chitinispirillum alkaliphilum]
MKKILRLAFFTLLAALFVLHAQTRVSGIIDRDTRWVPDESPYIVEGDIVILPRARLLISPGTQVIISPGNTTPSSSPFDKLDSTLISIRVQGALSSVGRKDNPIIFRAENSRFQEYKWRGIILDGAADQFTEIAYTEVSCATTAITAKNCSPVVRNSILENNNVGIHCLQGGSLRIYNNVIARNFTAGIKVEASNPQIQNNIIAFNRNLGLWCDGISKVKFAYNCIYGNSDGNFLDCDPELGMLVRINHNQDSTDRHWNLIQDPVFSGSLAETRAMELDTNLPTKHSQIIDTSLAQLIHSSIDDSVNSLRHRRSSHRYSLSGYSPCINAGNPGRNFRNDDGTRNSIGTEGGPEFWSD